MNKITPTGGLANFTVHDTDYLDEETIANILADESVFSFQMGELLASKVYPYVFQENGIKGLWFTSFLDGIAEATQNAQTKTAKEIKEQAIEWVKSNDGICSFAWYCHIFKIERIEEARRIILSKT